MKRGVLKIILILFFSCAFTHAFSQSLIKEYKTINGENVFSYINNEGKVIIPYGKYDISYTDTIKTIGFVLKSKNIVAVNNKGKELFNVFVFDNGPDYPINNIFRIIRKDKMGLADMKGNIIFKPKYDFIRLLPNGYGVFNIGGKTKKLSNSDYSEFIGGKWGIIDYGGKVIFPAIFDKIECSQNNKIAVQINNRKFIISATN